MLPALVRRSRLRKSRWRSCLALALLLSICLLAPPPLGPSEPASALAQSTEVAYVVEQSGSGMPARVVRVDLTTGTQTIATAGDRLRRPEGIALAPNGDLLIADAECCDDRNDSGGVIRVNPSTGAQTIVTSGPRYPDQGFKDPVGVAVAANGDLFVVDVTCCNEFKGGVFRVNAATSVANVLAWGGNFQRPSGIAIEASGNLIVVDAGGAVFRVDPTSGTRTTVSSARYFEGGHFYSPKGIAIAANGDLLVADPQCCEMNRGGVIRVNPITGTQSILSSTDAFKSPGGIAIAANGDLLVADPDCCGSFNAGERTGGLFRVNPTSGVPTLLSQGGHLYRPIAVAIGRGATSTLPVLTVNDASVQEGHSGTANLTFTATLVPPSSQTVSVQFASEDFSARAGTDYTAVSGRLTFNPGETSKTIVVPVIGDIEPENDETFAVFLTTPVGAVLAQTRLTGTILNDDGPQCDQRPRTTTTQSVNGGALSVQVRATVSNAGVVHRLQQLQFGTFQNAVVTLGGQPVSSGQTVTLPGGSTSADLVVRRAIPGQPTTVPFSVVDSCGTWKTFVGGGASAGF